MDVADSPHDLPEKAPVPSILRLARLLAFDVSLKVFYPSVVAGLLVMVTLTLKPLQIVCPQGTHIAWLAPLIRRYFDVGAIQFISLVLLVYLTYRYVSRTKGVSGLRLAAVVVGLFVLVMGLEVGCEELFLKPSFRYGRQFIAATGESGSVAWVASKIGIGSDDTGAAPSGFAMRQTIILLFFLSLAHQKDWHKVVSRRWNRYLHWLQYGLFVLVPFLRFYRGRHSLFDLGTGIGIGVFLFWYFVIGTSVLVNRTAQSRMLLGDLFMRAGTYLVVVLFFCQETRWWQIATLAMILGLGVIYAVTEPRRGRSV